LLGLPSVTGATLRLVDPLTVPRVAVMVEFPDATAVASPPFWPLTIVATLVFPDDHSTWAVRFAVALLLYVPVAVNCSVAPMATEGFDGVTAIEYSDGPVETVRLTGVPAFSVALAAGLVLMILPAATVLLVAMVTVPTTRSAF
jgi:hypothetical protein